MPHNKDLDALRSDILLQSLEDANTPKYGYFGFAPPLAIGDTSLAPQAKRKSAEEETIKSFVIGMPKKGQTDDVLFAAMPPLALGDPYVDPAKRNKADKVKWFDPEKVFKPAGQIARSLNKLDPYEYVPGADAPKDPKKIYQKYKETDFIILHPPNIKCQPTKKGGGGVLTPGVLMNVFPEHVPDEYDRARAIKREEQKKHHTLLQETPFRSMAYGGKSFADNTETFFCDIPHGIPRPVVKKDMHAYPHESAFKPANPSKKGFNGLMGWPKGRGEPPQTFPDWIPDPAPAAKRKGPESTGDERQAFKPPNPGGLDNPQKSVMMHSRNLRAMYPQSFVRPRI
jgi:hypothetical protein